MDHLPSIKKAYSLVVQKESNNAMFLASISLNEPVVNSLKKSHQ